MCLVKDVMDHVCPNITESKLQKAYKHYLLKILYSTNFSSERITSLTEKYHEAYLNIKHLIIVLEAKKKLNEITHIKPFWDIAINYQQSLQKVYKLIVTQMVFSMTKIQEPPPSLSLRIVWIKTYVTHLDMYLNYQPKFTSMKTLIINNLDRFGWTQLIKHIKNSFYQQ